MEVDLQDELDRIAARVGCSVSLDSPSGRLLGYSVQAGDADAARISAILARQVPDDVRRWQDEHRVSTATAPVRLPDNPALGMSARLCVTLRERDVVRGYLWVVEPRTPLPASDVDEVVRAGERVLAALVGRAWPDVAGHLGRLLGDLVDARTDDDGERVVGAMVEAEPALLGAQVRFVVGAAPRALATAGPVALVRATEPLPALAHGPAVPFDAPHLRLGLAQARLAAQCAQADPRLAPGSWDGLGLYQLFLGVPDLAAWQAPLAGLDPVDDSAAMLLSTLETYLDLAGDAQRTASALTLHRTTLYYRLNRAVAALGGDLSDGAWRTHLHLALKARRLSVVQREGS